jgi:hypothetical protein
MLVATRSSRSSTSLKPTPFSLSLATKRALKWVLIGFACVAALVVITIWQTAVDQMSSDVEPNQTLASAPPLGP